MTTANSQAELSIEQGRRRNPRFLILLLVLLCGLFVAGYVERLSRLEAMQAQVEAVKQQIVDSQQRNAYLSEELLRVEDPSYLALRARNDIGLAPEGEVPIAIYDGKPQIVETPAATPPLGGASAAKPPWQQWLELIIP
jgi:cell division protein FtsB